MPILKKRLYFDTSPESVAKKLSGFPKRYRRYRSQKYKGEWQCRLLIGDSNQFVFQMVDQTFDITKGNAKPESPLITLAIRADGENSSVTDIFLKWQNLMVLIACFLPVLYLLFCGYAIANGWWGMFVPYLVLFVLHFCWIWRRIRHDRLTMDVFADMLMKNFESR